jgi:hypothetical protein
MLPGNDAGMHCVGDERVFFLLPGSLVEYQSSGGSPRGFEPSAEPGATIDCRADPRFPLLPQ